MSDVLGTIASGGSRIGRYFSVVSALPSTIFAGYVFVLARTGAFTGPVRWSRVTELGAVDLLVLGLVSFVLALALHPLQFTIVQLYEGYWGTSRLGLGLALIRTLHHRRRRLLLDGRRWRSSAAASSAMTAFARPRQVAARIENAESARLRGSYPDRLEFTLPTRLGNVLRRYESTVGAPYGMEAMQAIPRLAMVAGERELDYLQNQRFQLDLAVRTSFLGFAATLVTGAAMWRHGWWMLLALVPYAVGYLVYRGAIVLAHEYGMSAAVMMDLSRFALYDRMRLPPPDDNEDELRANPHLMRAFRSELPPPLPGRPAHHLPGADLRGVRAENVDLRWADLRGANLRGADLTSAKLQWACLEGADLTGAVLDKADATGAATRGAAVPDGITKNATSWPAAPTARPGSCS